MRKKLGNAIAQYGIIIALIALAVIPVCFVLGGTIVQQLTNFGQGLGTVELTNNGDGNGDIITPTDPHSPTNPLIPDNGDGSSGDVDITCSGQSCTIDFGDYQLSGIPENFGDYIESSGASGGTDAVVALLEQIADSPALTEEQSNLVQQLANKGHSLAIIEDIIEQQAQSLSDNGIGPDAGFEENGQQLNTSLTEFDTLFASVLSSLSNEPDAKVLVEILANQIVNLGSNMSSAHQLAISSCSDELSCDSDQLQGETVATGPYHDSLGHIISPDASTVTDLDSALICATGHGDDNGIECD